jgi:hypothetical protein
LGDVVPVDRPRESPSQAGNVAPVLVDESLERWQGHTRRTRLGPDV